MLSGVEQHGFDIQVGKGRVSIQADMSGAPLHDGDLFPLCRIHQQMRSAIQSGIANDFYLALKSSRN